MISLKAALLPFVLALSSSVFLTISLKRVAVKVGLVDDPNRSEHKTHSSPAALVGGISIFISFCFTLLFINLPIAELRPLFAASIVLVVIGVLDDLHELSPLMRFASQIIACCIMIFIGMISVYELGRLLTDQVLSLGFFAIPFTIFAVVGVINAFNMSDGMDGQSGTLAVAILTVLISLCYLQNDIQGATILIALFGAVVGFLIFNLRLSAKKPASVFMGDAGSMFIGFVISWYMIRLSQGPDAVIKPITAVWILALPICDTLTVMIRRALLRKSPLQADRTHYHHLFQAAGMSVNSVLFILLLTTLGFGGIAYSIQDIPGMEKYMFYGYLFFVLIYYFWSSNKIRKYEQ